MARIARLMGFSRTTEFEEAVLARLTAVTVRTSDLFRDAPALSSGQGSLVFTGGDDDPDTLRTLSRLGYREPAAVTAAVRAWHFGRYPAMRSTAARERLTELTPALLETFARVGNPDQAVRAFDALLKGLPAGVQLLAMLASNRQLLDLLALILGAAPRLAETFARRPHVVDALIDPNPAWEMDRRAFAAGLAATIDQAADFEDALDRARRFAAEQRFLVATRLLMRRLGTEAAGAAFSDLAEVVVEALFARVRDEFARQHGAVPGGRAAIVAFGRLGSREMTMTSDLDLIVVYDHAAGAASSDGRKPLSPMQYYTRLTQRLVAALSAPTAQGAAYAVDLRLRPSGRAGPLATHVEAFARYQAEDAWTWEHMALSRARSIAGDRALRERVAATVAGLIARPRDGQSLARDISDMRERVAEARGDRGPWALKTARGGLIDAEFVAQYVVLAGLERRAGEPTAATLARAVAEGALPSAPGGDLVRAADLQGALLQGLRVADDRPFDPAGAPEGLKAFLAALGDEAAAASLARLGGSPPPGAAREPMSFAALEARLRDVQEAARRAARLVLADRDDMPSRTEAGAGATERPS
jgi:glutamate-ammonia-ligase adenylyltransferase